VVEAVAEGGGNDRFRGDAGELRFEPAFEFGDERRGFGVADGQTRGGTPTTDLLLDRIERGDAGERFLGERRGAAFGEVVEPPPQMRPTEGEGCGAGLAPGVRRYVRGLRPAARPDVQ
jgi:hypothetical protein